MMRQSPKPYAKGKEGLTPPCPRCPAVLPRQHRFSTLLAVRYLNWGHLVAHLSGSGPTNRPFVLLAGRPVSNW